MANSLGMDLTGKAVVVKKEAVNPEYDTEFSHAFLCKSGFGCLPETTGSMIYGHWLDNPEKPDSIRGHDIEKLYEQKESMGSKEIMARLAKNLDTVKRVLAITDIKDPDLAKEVKEFFILKTEVTKLKDDLEAKELVMKSKLDKSIAPKLKEASDSLFRIEGTIYKFAEVSRTSVSYSDLYTMLLSKVNKQIQDMMATMKEELSKVSSYFKFEEIGEESDPKTIKKIMKEQEKKAALKKDLLFPIVVVTYPTKDSVLDDILFKVDTLTGLYNQIRGGLTEAEIAGVFPDSEYKQAEAFAKDLMSNRKEASGSVKKADVDVSDLKAEELIAGIKDFLKYWADSEEKVNLDFRMQIEMLLDSLSLLETKWGSRWYELDTKLDHHIDEYVNDTTRLLNEIIDGLRKGNIKPITSSKTNGLERISSLYWRFNVLKETEGGPGSKFYQEVLKGVEGIKVRTYPSSYVGHTVVEVEASNQEDMRKALRELEGAGLIEGIEEEIKYHVTSASLQVEAGIWDKIKEVWNKLSGYFSSFVASLTDSADEMEALVEEAQGDVQTQEVEASLKGIFTTGQD